MAGHRTGQDHDRQLTARRARSRDSYLRKTATARSHDARLKVAVDYLTSALHCASFRHHSLARDAADRAATVVAAITEELYTAVEKETQR